MKKILSGFTAVVLGLGLANLSTFAAFAAPPANDEASEAQVITGTSGSVGGTTFEGTTPENAPDVWYRWRAPANLSMGFGVHSTGGSIDSQLAVYQEGLTGVSQVTTDDNSGSSYDPVATFEAQSGFDYLIQVSATPGDWPSE